MRLGSTNRCLWKALTRIIAIGMIIQLIASGRHTHGIKRQEKRDDVSNTRRGFTEVELAVRRGSPGFYERQTPGLLALDLAARG